jgi:hypothetical protein
MREGQCYRIRARDQWVVGVVTRCEDGLCELDDGTVIGVAQIVVAYPEGADDELELPVIVA